MKNPLISGLSLISFLLASHVQAATFLVDFGTQNATTATTGWNNLTARASGSTTGAEVSTVGHVESLVTSTGAASSVTLEIISGFSADGPNNNGTTSSTLSYPGTATQDSAFGHTGAFGIDTDGAAPIFKLTNLDTSLIYNFTFYASRTGLTAGTVRQTIYSVAGLTNSSATLNVANNVNNTANVSGIAPDANGEIRISLTAGTTDNSAAYTYLGVMEFTAVPEPSSAILLGLGSIALLRRRR